MQISQKQVLSSNKQCLYSAKLVSRQQILLQQNQRSQFDFKKAIKQIKSGLKAQEQQVVYGPNKQHIVNTQSQNTEQEDIEVADLENLIKEKDNCGVGVICKLDNQKSYEILKKTIVALTCFEHRGGCSADKISGDGAGIMAQVPWKLLKSEYSDIDENKTAVAQVFFPNDDVLEKKCQAVFEKICSDEKLKFKYWRDTPVDSSIPGPMASRTQPRFKQAIVEVESLQNKDDIEREVYICMKMIEKEIKKELQAEDAANFYICSFSTRTIVYKGMLNSKSLALFYKDLTNELFETSFTVYHRRYSTNTAPRWPLAQPMRFLGHNGEINTLQGNINWMQSTQQRFTHPNWQGREQTFIPIVNQYDSDSANLDHAAEVMVKTGFSAAETVMLLVPEAYRNHPTLQRRYPEVVDFYEYYEGVQEGWDGPALLIFSDGKTVGARLDRNGLRPARYWEDNEGCVYIASEVGVFDDVIQNAKNITVQGRLGPGQMVVCDMEENHFYENAQIARKVATSRPFGEYIESCLRLKKQGVSDYKEEVMYDPGTVLQLQACNGMSLEDVQMVVDSMASQGVEPTFCMGDTIPLALLSGRPHLMYDYFKQRFAQVTNPPIDPIREGLVMSLQMRLGARGNLLDPAPYHQLFLNSPVLLENEVEYVKNYEALGSKEIKLFYDGGKPGTMAKALDELCSTAEDLVRNGSQCIVLSDKPELGNGALLSATRPTIPALLAVGAVHHHLIRKGLRTTTSIVAETAQCFSTHHLAVLVGYGAHAVCPYLGFESARQWRSNDRTVAQIKSGKISDLSLVDVQRNFKKALEKGLMKIMSKMGISLLSCYHGAQVFEIFGFSKEVVDLAFKGSISRIEGLSLDEIQSEAEQFWIKGFPEKQITKLEDYGYINYKPKGEFHANNPQMSKLLQKAVGLKKGQKIDFPSYEAYVNHFKKNPVSVLRDCLEIVTGKDPVSKDEVEPAEKIMTRFCTGGMSLGAISKECHETIALAMNRIKGKSNSGEGGEDPARWLRLNDLKDGQSEILPNLKGLQEGDTASSQIKQVASGRFGVTPQFLVQAEQLEIKIAQGAKPGEGGQLPGKKVSPYIADLRKSKPGVPLISPPPHHDIYSIEDLAQLIYDLHQINKRAKVSVKLVAEAGIGTIAAGVAKANADVIQVSGHDGGTGASPVSSIKHAGGPTELGLAEVQQALVFNELREQVVIRADGGCRTGRDVLVFAALGGDEYGFGTTAMIATGCIMARVCHTNNCPVGVASQREELRARFPGVPGDLVNYLYLVADEVRGLLAELGLRSLDELVGQSKYLKQKTSKLQKTSNLNLDYLRKYAGDVKNLSYERILAETHDNGYTIDNDLVQDPEILSAIENRGTVTKHMKISNTDRATLGRLAGLIATKYGDSSFEGRIEFKVQGSAGQSFCCWLVDGMYVELVGEANDYLGKGMNGGTIVVLPPPEGTIASGDNVLVGNTCLYGATGGKLFVLGQAGERFGVRNSLCNTVIEGVGDHCCEYMTGGNLVCLGKAGRNVGAGMTGGIAYFYDEKSIFLEKVNAEIVTTQRIQTKEGADHLRGFIQEHYDLTKSPKAKMILDNFSEEVGKFWQLVPPSEKNFPETNPGLSQYTPEGEKVPQLQQA